MTRLHCAGEHLGTSCTGAPSLRCGACGAVRYCSSSHQRLHWPEHRLDCHRFEEQVKRGVILHDFPFTFSHDSTFLIDNGTLSICSFLERLGVHAQGLWQAECECKERSPSAAGSGALAVNESGWSLSCNMCPCRDADNAVSKLESWADYYAWRGLPLESPVAILLHWPLTLYHALWLAAARGGCSNDLLMQKVIHIHHLGPHRELDQLEVFAELSVLLRSEHIHIDFIGPDVPRSRDKKGLVLDGLAKCSESASRLLSKTDRARCNVSLKFWRGVYHDVYKDLVKGSPPDIVFAPNAGIAAYQSWLPTVNLLNELEIPAIFTDFCEEATLLASTCVEALGCKVTIPVQVNPFRQPMTPPNKVLELPTYSNCFLFGIN